LLFLIFDITQLLYYFRNIISQLILCIIRMSMALSNSYRLAICRGKTMTLLFLFFHIRPTSKSSLSISSCWSIDNKTRTEHNIF